MGPWPLPSAAKPTVLLHYVAGRGLADTVKVIDRSALNERDYPGLFRGPNVITGVLRAQKGAERKRGGGGMRRTGSRGLPAGK